MDTHFILTAIGICVLYSVFSPASGDGLITIDGVLVLIVDNCTLGDSSSCGVDHCCTKKTLSYPAGFQGDQPVYQLECKPLRQAGEFCYYATPENFCPCANTCHSNGFYGSCT